MADVATLLCGMAYMADGNNGESQGDAEGVDPGCVWHTRGGVANKCRFFGIGIHAVKIVTTS